MLGGRNKGNQLSLMEEYAQSIPGAANPNSGTLRREVPMRTDRANRLKSDFISHISHELRTPLNAVIGFSKLIKSHGVHPLTDEEIVSYADHVHTAAGRLLAFVNDVLELSKLQNGSCSLVRDDVDVGQVLSALVEEIRERTKGNRVEVRLEVEAEMLVDGDAHRLRRALGNLLENAVQFTPGGGTVVVAAAPRDGRIFVTVRDTGVGMTDDEIRLALTPFGLAEWKNLHADGARGLGLPLAQALIRAHGGELQISSVEGAGTEVCVSLPAIAVHGGAHCDRAAAG